MDMHKIIHAHNEYTKYGNKSNQKTTKLATGYIKVSQYKVQTSLSNTIKIWANCITLAYV